MSSIRDSHYTLGKAYFEDGQYEQAITQFEAALAIDTNFIDAYHALSLCYFGQGDLASARSAAEQALSIDGSYQPSVSFLRAITVSDLNLDATTPESEVSDESTTPSESTTPPDKPETPKEPSPTSVIPPRPDTLQTHDTPQTPDTPQTSVDTDKEMQRGLVFLTNKQYPQAEACFKKVIKSDSHNANAHYNLGQTYLEIGAYDDAVREADLALRIKPDYPAAVELKKGVSFLRKRSQRQQLTRNLTKYAIPVLVVAIIVFFIFSKGILTGVFPERVPLVSIDATLEDPTNDNGLIEAGEHVRLKLTLTNRGSTVRNLRVHLIPKTIGGLKYASPERLLTIHKKGFETVRVPIFADNKVHTRKVTVKIEVLDKAQKVLADTDFIFDIKSK